MVSNYQFNQYQECMDKCIADIKIQIAALGGGGVNYIVGDGSTAQYIRGDGSKATFPTIPTNSSYVDRTTNQAAIDGTKDWLKAHTFAAGISITGTLKNTNGGAVLQTSNVRGTDVMTFHDNTTPLTSNYYLSNGATEGTFLNHANTLALRIANTNKISVATSLVTIAPALTLSTITALATAASVFLVSDSGVVKSRTAAQMLSDLNGAAKVSALDFEITDQTKGLIQKDRGDSIRKRLVVTNGVSTWEAA